jgi:predicted amidohydrolase
VTRIAVLQMTSGIDPEANLDTIVGALTDARAGAAAMVFTPEMSLLLDRDRERAASNIEDEAENSRLNRLCAAVAEQKVWLALGSMALRRADGRLANRAFVISPEGEVVGRYDKIHMFDVALSTGESWKESAAYAPGEQVVVVDSTPVGRLGLAVCYDIRFPALFEELGRQTCDVIAIPAAFTVPTGEAHWHLLQRARAVEASAYVVAAAQVGEHADGRRTYGHSLVVDPWGEVLLDMGGEAPGLGFAEIDPARIAQVRAQLPSLANRRTMATSTGQ